jgi:hypothetical protein
VAGDPGRTMPTIVWLMVGAGAWLVDRDRLLHRKPVCSCPNAGRAWPRPNGPPARKAAMRAANGARGQAGEGCRGRGHPALLPGARAGVVAPDRAPSERVFRMPTRTGGGLRRVRLAAGAAATAMLAFASPQALASGDTPRLPDLVIAAVSAPPQRAVPSERFAALDVTLNAGRRARRHPKRGTRWARTARWHPGLFPRSAKERRRAVR